MSWYPCSIDVDDNERPIADSMANDAPFYSVPADDRFDSVCMYVCM